jgi:hypothetical protein
MKINSIEEQIRRLEASLQEGGEDDGEDSDSDSDVEEDNAGMLVETDASGKVVRLVSSLVTERIAPLPKEKLPLPMCSRGGGAARAASSSTSSSSSSRKGVRFSDEDAAAGAAAKRPRKELSGGNVSGRGGSGSSSGSGGSGSGLEAAVREMLANYIPSSAERRPFWCRICRLQSTDLDGFNAHMQSQEHLMAVKLERKMSYCKLCKKQFTSPAQLKEHLQGNQHKEHLAKVLERQKGGKTSFS